MVSKRVVVVLPALNEGAAIGEVIRGIPRVIDDLEVVPLVVDDGSSDDTSRTARSSGALVIKHVTNVGVGAATRTGFAAALDMGAYLVVTMDSDGQHDPSDIPALVRQAVQGNYDLVIGNRMMQPKGMPFSRVAANWLLNAITLVAYGGSVSDSQSGFKCLSRSALQTMELKADQYDICSEIVGEIFSKGLTYSSVLVKPVYTSYSQAKGQHYLNGINIILQLLVRMMRRV